MPFLLNDKHGLTVLGYETVYTK